MADNWKTFVVTTRSMMQDDLKDIQEGRTIIKIDGIDVTAKRCAELINHIEHATKVLDEEENASRR
jgi:hypothetical protein